MKSLKPINQEKQLFDVLEGKPEADQKAKAEKIQHISDNIHNVVMVNGKKVYDPIVDGEHINYNLQKRPDWMELDGTGRKYYYPIEYAEIIIK